MATIIKYNPTICWYCGDYGGTEPHHIYRGAERSTSPVVWICRKCHDKATHNKWFEKHLIMLYEKYERTRQQH